MQPSFLVIGLTFTLAVPATAIADAGHGDDNADHAPISIQLELPEMDAEVGRELFVEKDASRVMPLTA